MLVKLKDNKGSVLFLNPAHVLLVSGASVNGAPAIGEAVVVLDNGSALGVSGTPDEVNDVLSGKTPAKSSGPSKLFPFREQD